MFGTLFSQNFISLSSTIFDAIFEQFWTSLSYLQLVVRVCGRRDNFGCILIHFLTNTRQGGNYTCNKKSCGTHHHFLVSFSSPPFTCMTNFLFFPMKCCSPFKTTLSHSQWGHMPMDLVHPIKKNLCFYVFAPYTPFVVHFHKWVTIHLLWIFP